jgi:predicted RecA/RadA family phage recombinase
MKNYVQPGEVLEFTAPAGGVTSGQGYIIGDTFVVATITAAAAAKFNGMIIGVFELAKTPADVIAEGVRIFWDNTAKQATVTATANRLIGHAAEARGATTTSVKVRLNGNSLPAAAATS